MIQKEIFFTKIIKIADNSEKPRICKSIINQLPGWFILPIEAEIFSNESIESEFWAVYLDEEPVGFISVRKKSDKIAEVIAMGILCGYQHLGMGRGLMESVFSWCKSESIETLEVKTADYSDPDVKYISTRNFYEKMGFKPLDTIPHYWQDNTPLLIMIKNFVWAGQEMSVGLKIKELRN